jgi:hypothetical protein
MMITERDVRRRGESILLGIAVESAVLDIVTNETLLRACVSLLAEERSALAYTQMGTFGTYPVTLNSHHDDTVSIFVDGPEFEENRTQSSAIWVGKQELRELLLDVLQFE